MIIDMGDIAKIPIKIELIGIGTAEGLIERYKGPFSADALLEKLPFVMRGRFSFGSKKYWILPSTNIRKGLNSKAAKNVQEGDIVYSPKTDEIVFILEDSEFPNSVNKIGRITSNIELFNNARNGINTKIYKG